MLVLALEFSRDVAARAHLAQTSGDRARTGRVAGACAFKRHTRASPGGQPERPLPQNGRARVQPHLQGPNPCRAGSQAPKGSRPEGRGRRPGIRRHTGEAE
jgi:hypothetical protein